MDNEQPTFGDPSQPFEAQRQALARRRKLAEQLIAKGMEGNTGSGYQGGRVYIVGNPLGNIASSVAGNIFANQADRDQSTLEASQRQHEQTLMDAIANAPDPQQRQAAMLRAMQQAPSLRDAIKMQVGWDEAEANRVERGEQLAADRVARSQEAEAKLIDAGEQKAADRVARQDLRSTPTIHITNSGGGGGHGKAPSGYKWNEDGSLSPITGGPADKQPGTKPLTAKQLETQRGFMDLQSSLDTYDNALNSYDFKGKSALDPAARAALEGAYTDVQMKLKTLYELGAPQAGDLRLLEQSITNPVSAFGTVKGTMFGAEPHKAKVKQLRNLLTNSQKNFETQMGKATPEAAKPEGPKTIVREVKLKDGRIGVEYSDGTRGFK